MDLFPEQLVEEKDLNILQPFFQNWGIAWQLRDQTRFSHLYWPPGQSFKAIKSGSHMRWGITNPTLLWKAILMSDSFLDIYALLKNQICIKMFFGGKLPLT